MTLVPKKIQFQIFAICYRIQYVFSTIYFFWYWPDNEIVAISS